MNSQFAKYYRIAVADIIKNQKTLLKIAEEQKELNKQIKLWETLHGTPTLHSEAYDVGTRVKSI